MANTPEEHPPAARRDDEAIPAPGPPSAAGLFGGLTSRASSAALVGANLVPLLGVLLAGWRTFPILLLFSLENVVIGAYNVLRMLRTECDLAELRSSSDGSIKTKAGLIAFFCLHYGMFTFVHLLFVVVLFGVVFAPGVPANPGLVPVSPGSDVLVHPGSFALVSEDWAGLAAALLCMVFSHGVSYRKNFIQGGEYKRITTSKLMIRPYGRVMIMHVTIIGGGFAAAATGNHAIPVAMLVLLKTGVDLIAHVLERRKFRKRRNSAAPS